MKLRHLFTVHAVMDLVFGLAMLLVPVPLMSLYGLALGPGGTLNTRLFGAAVIGFGLLSWFVRHAPESEARRAIVLAYFLACAVGFIASLVGQLSGVTNSLGWSTVGLYLLLALAYGYFQFTAPSSP